MPRLTIVYNPLDKTDRDILQVSGDTLEQCLDDVALPENALVAVDGRDADMATVVHADSIITVIPQIEGGGGGKDGLLMTAAQLGLMAAAMYFGGPAGLALSGWQLSLFVGASTAIGGYVLNEAFGSSAAVNYNAPELSGYDSSGGVAYSWSPQTTQAQGICIPVVYGRMSVTGNVIASYVHNDDDGQYLSVLIALCEGQIDSVESIQINGQPIDNYPDVSVDIRLGTANQGHCAGFSLLKNETPFSIYLDRPENPYEPIFTHQTSSDDIQAFEFDITFPQGLYKYVTMSFETDGGEQIERGYLESKVAFKLEIYDSSDALLYEKEFSITDNVTSSRTYTFYFAEELFADAYVSGNQLSMARASLYNSLQQDYTDLTIKLYRYTLVADGDPELVIQTVNEAYLTSVREVVDTAFRYPGIALVGIRALATSSLSSTLSANITLKGKICRVYRNGYWHVEWTDNPAWVCYDVLTSPLIVDGQVIKYYGYDQSELNLAQFTEWADYCDELVDTPDGQQKRCTFNGVYDSVSNMWAAACLVAQAGRANLARQGGKPVVIIDRPSEPTQMFCDGNIDLDSFKGEFLPFVDRARELEVTFVDADNGFEKTQLKYTDVHTDEQPNTASYNLFGVTNAHQAARHAALQLGYNRHCLRTQTFRADIDAIAAMVGDVVKLQSSIPLWGYSGRIDAVSGIDITLDHDWGLDGQSGYYILLRDDDGNEVQRSIASFSGREITMSAAVDNIDRFSLYMIGELTKSERLYRIVSISRPENLKSNIEVVEYNASIYDSVDTGSAVIEYDYLQNDVDASVRNLSVKSALITVDGSLKAEMTIGWSAPAGVLIDYYYVRITGQATGSVPVTQQVKDISLKLYVPADETYTVSVTAVPVFTMVSPATESVVYYVESKSILNTVLEFTATLTLQGILFTWVDGNPDRIYEIDMADSLLAKSIKGNTYIYPEILEVGDYTFKLYTVTSEGIRSATSKSFTLTISLPLAPIALVAIKELYCIRLSADYTQGTYFEGLEIWASQTNDRASAFHLTTIGSNEYPHDNLGMAASYYYWCRVRDKTGLKSEWFPASATGGVYGQTDTTPSKLLDDLQGELSEDQLVQSLVKRIDNIEPIIQAIIGVPFYDDGFYAPGTYVSTPADIGGLYGLIGRHTKAEVRISDSEGIISEHETAIYGDDGLLEMIYTAEQSITALQNTDGSLQSQINNRVAVGTFDALAYDFSLASTAITALQDATGALEASIEDMVTVATFNELGFTVGTIQQTLDAQADTLGNIQLEYAVKLDNNDYVTGFGLINNGAVSEFAILADKFTVVRPDGSGTPQQMFTVGTVAGIQAVGVNGNIIIDGSVIARNLAVDAVTANHLAVAFADVDTLDAMNAIINNLVVVSAEVTGVLKASVVDLAGSLYGQNVRNSEYNTQGLSSMELYNIASIDPDIFSGDTDHYSPVLEVFSASYQPNYFMSNRVCVDKPIISIETFANAQIYTDDVMAMRHWVDIQYSYNGTTWYSAQTYAWIVRNAYGDTVDMMSNRRLFIQHTPNLVGKDSIQYRVRQYAESVSGSYVFSPVSTDIKVTIDNYKMYWA